MKINFIVKETFSGRNMHSYIFAVKQLVKSEAIEFVTEAS